MYYIEGLVSCVIPTYKRSDTLLRAIHSVLNQSYKKIEVIVVDDNEPNDEYSRETQNKLSMVIDTRLRFVQQKKHINGAVARNVGIKEAHGEFITFLDDDDEWLPKKVEKQVTFLNANKNIDGVSTLYRVYKNGEVIRVCTPYTGVNLHRKVIDRSVSVFTSTILLRRKAFDEAGYFNESLLRHQDLQLLLDFLFDHKIGVLQEYEVKLHADSEINHPNVDKIIDIKKKFFFECHRHLERYGKTEQKEIMAAHYFEIAFAALRARRYGLTLKYLFKIGITPKAYMAVLSRYKNR